jgi:hypothetical protein
MTRLSLELDNKLTIMRKYELTAEDWMFVELLFLATEEHPHPEYLYTYFSECAKTSLPRDTLQALKDKKVLLASYKIPGPDEEFDPEQVEFNQNFKNFYFKESQEAGQQFFNAYPDFLQFGDKLLPARNITKGGYLSMEDFFFAYGKAIKNKPKTHEEVLEALAWAVEHELICYGIVEYLTTRKWLDHRRMMESGDIGKFAVRIDTMENI